MAKAVTSGHTTHRIAETRLMTGVVRTNLVIAGKGDAAREGADKVAGDKGASAARIDRPNFRLAARATDPAQVIVLVVARERIVPAAGLALTALEVGPARIDHRLDLPAAAMRIDHRLGRPAAATKSATVAPPPDHLLLAAAPMAAAEAEITHAPAVIAVGRVWAAEDTAVAEATAVAVVVE